MSGFHFILCTNNFLLISVSVVTLGQVYPVHFPRPIFFLVPNIRLSRNASDKRRKYLLQWRRRRRWRKWIGRYGHPKPGWLNNCNRCKGQNMIPGAEFINLFFLHERYNLSSVWVRLSIFSQLSTIQYVGLCVFSLPISFVMIERIYILCLNIIIKSEVWTITHCLGSVHETMACAVCISIFLRTL